MYSILRGWIDCAGRCRTWVLVDERGKRIAEVTRKRDALKLAALLSR